MEAEEAILRHRISEWSSDERLRLCALLNQTVVEAQQITAKGISASGWQDLLPNRAKGTFAQFDALTCDLLEPRLSFALDKAARRLRLISPSLEAIALTMPATVWPTLPWASRTSAAKPSAGFLAFVPEAIQKAAEKIGNIQPVGMQQLSQQFASGVKSLVNVDEGLRSAVHRHAATRWLDVHGQSLSIAARLDTSIREVAREARRIVGS